MLIIDIKKALGIIHCHTVVQVHKQNILYYISVRHVVLQQYNPKCTQVSANVINPWSSIQPDGVDFNVHIFLGDFRILSIYMFTNSVYYHCMCHNE